MPFHVETTLDEMIVEIPRARTWLDRGLALSIVAALGACLALALWPEASLQQLLDASPPEIPDALAQLQRCVEPADGGSDACAALAPALADAPDRDEAVAARRAHWAGLLVPPIRAQSEPGPLPEAWAVTEPGDRVLIAEILAAHAAPGRAPIPAPESVQPLIAQRALADASRYESLLEASRRAVIAERLREVQLDHALALVSQRDRLLAEIDEGRGVRAGLARVAGAAVFGLGLVAWRRRRRTARVVLDNHTLTSEGVQVLWEDLSHVRVDPDRISWAHGDGRPGAIDRLSITAEQAGALLGVFDHRLNHPREPRDPALEAQLMSVVSGRTT